MPHPPGCRQHLRWEVCDPPPRCRCPGANAVMKAESKGQFKSNMKKLQKVQVHEHVQIILNYLKNTSDTKSSRTAYRPHLLRVL